VKPVEEAVLEHRGKLLGYIEKRVSDPDLAEDVLQESLLKALRASDALRDEDRLLPWFYRILNNAIVDTYRRRGTEAKYLEAYAREEDTSAASQDHAEICACFRALIPSLKPEYAQLIEDLDLSEKDPREVARQLDISPGNLKVRRHRARQALRSRLEETCRTCAIHSCLDCTCKENAV
jgi:RNA polymerase sigma factor (sigma-70 family)